MRIYREAWEVYKRADGRRLACLVHEYGDDFRAVMVESKRGDRTEDSIRMAHWPGSSPSSIVTEHRTFDMAVMNVERFARSWKRRSGDRSRVLAEKKIRL